MPLWVARIYFPEPLPEVLEEAGESKPTDDLTCA
jgi:hypothetical protein